MALVQQDRGQPGRDLGTTATFGVAAATITTVEQGAVQGSGRSVSGATGGTFRLVHASTATEAIPFDASTEQMGMAMGALPSLGK